MTNGQANYSIAARRSLSASAAWRSKGAAIIQGVVGVWIIIGFCTAASLVILDLGSISYFQNKLTVITQQASHFAAMNYNNTALVSQTNAFVQLCMQDSGMPYGAGTTVTINQVTVNNQPAESVSITTTAPLLGNGSWLPFQTTISDQHASIIAMYNPVAYAWWPGAGPGSTQYAAPGSGQDNTGIGIICPVSYVSSMPPSVGTVYGLPLIQMGATTYPPSSAVSGYVNHLGSPLP